MNNLGKKLCASFGCRDWGYAPLSKKKVRRMKKYADMNRSERSFVVGDIVYLKMQPYRETTLHLHITLKLSSKYYGPFRVLKKWDLYPINRNFLLVHYCTMFSTSTCGRSSWDPKQSQIHHYHCSQLMERSR
jgi:hypothetical protein